MAKQQAVAAYDWNQHEGNTGLENLTTKDLGIPILQILQKGSAEIDEDHEDHETKKIEGAKVGDIINNVSREILFAQGKTPVRVVPYFYTLVYVEWREKKNGGGIAQTHTSEEILRHTTRNPENGKDMLPNGNYVATTAYFFVRVLHDDGRTEDALIAMSSTQLKKSRLWLNMMKNNRAANGNTLPMFSKEYFLTSVPESNAKGTWRGWKIEAASAPITDSNLINSLVEAVKSSHANAVALIGNSGAPAEEDIV